RCSIECSYPAIATKRTPVPCPSNFGNLRDVATPRKRGGNAAATACGQRLIPAAFLCGQLDDASTTADIEGLRIPHRNLSRRAQRGEPKCKWITAGGMGGYGKAAGTNKLVAGAIE